MSVDATWKVRLDAELADVETAMQSAADAAGVVVLDQSCVGRVSRMDAMQQQALSLDHLARLRQRRRKLQAALPRIEEGSYGLCCQCAAPLDAARLQADAAAVFCADCAAERG